jgi:hypothetical protein
MTRVEHVRGTGRSPGSTSRTGEPCPRAVIISAPGKCAGFLQQLSSGRSDSPLIVIRWLFPVPREPTTGAIATSHRGASSARPSFLSRRGARAPPPAAGTTPNGKLAVAELVYVPPIAVAGKYRRRRRGSPFRPGACVVRRRRRWHKDAAGAVLRSAPPRSQVPAPRGGAGRLPAPRPWPRSAACRAAASFTAWPRGSRRGRHRPAGRR